VNFDLSFHIAEILTLLTICGTCIATAVKVIRAAQRVETTFKNFPPHRHINGSIVYPEGYEPTPIQQLYANGKGAGA
jgi:hypothetical protein